MSNRDALRKELVGLSDPLIGEVVDFVRVLKRKKRPSDAEFWKLLQQTYGLLPELSRPPQGEMPSPKNWA